MNKLHKLARCIVNPFWRVPLVRGVAAAVEHDLFFSKFSFNTVIDIGANVGQFSLVMKKNFPHATIYAFEPLKTPFQKLSDIFATDVNVKIFNSAIGPETKETLINVSSRNDSSSLLPISKLQNDIFPGTLSIGQEKIMMAPLSNHLTENDFQNSVLLKLDVQGFELEALKGCENFLNLVTMVYCECSFVELYAGQALAHEVIEYLSRHEFVLKALINVQHDQAGQVVQADFAFSKLKR